ncbi:MAG: asparagine synthase (glutamine-hydrolyzing) [Gemmatimonadaceae bacterium]|nr:asparagine synthase (glutamine-hydrolyzing) [Gemmatimonadaceae bacterium]
MCGIAGCWHLDGRPVEPQALARLTDAVAHRGPDGRGVHVDDGGALGLGHRRLAILDLSDEARQPMPYADGRWWLVFNGEIFNFLELRKELEQRGHRFHTASDSEVILAAWAQWGERSFLRFNGMWALAIWDRVERRLILSRDRFGIKPLLYVHEAGRRFAFASEQRAFAELEDFHPAFDEDAARTVILDPFALEGTARGSWRGVQRLPAGHWIEVGPKDVTVRRWWRTVDHLPEVPSALPAQAARFRELFEDSIRLRMRSDVAIGTCLSGGFDSSAVVCAMGALGGAQGDASGRRAPEWQRTFVATFPGAANDERPFAEEVIAWAGVEGTFLPLTDADAAPDLAPTLEALEEVYQSPPTAVWRIYRELRHHGVVVSLDGHGADEMMGAYMGIGQLLLQDAPHLLSHPLRNVRLLQRWLAEVEPASRPRGKAGAAAAALRLVLGAHPDLATLRPLMRRWRSRVASPALGGRSAFMRGRPRALPDLIAPAARDVLPDHWQELDRNLYRLFHVDVLPTILRNFDRLSSAHGVEVRMPFMDWRLVTYVMALPASSKVGDGLTKRIAREAMRDRMPESIRAARRKVGFNSPLPEWLGGPLAGWASDLLSSAPADHPIVDITALRAAVQAARANGWDAHRAQVVWPFLHYLWLERALGARRIP